MRDDRNDAALDAMAAAEAAVRAFAPMPSAPVQWRAWAQWHRVGGQVLAFARRGPEAVVQLGHAATEFRHCGDDLAALEMDAFAGRILLGDGRPDLAEPILRAAFTSARSVLPAAEITRVIGDLLAYTLADLGRPHDAAVLRAQLG